MKEPVTQGQSGSALLAWIVAFKALKALLLTSLGFGLLFSLRRDPVAVVWSIGEARLLRIAILLLNIGVVIYLFKRKEVFENQD